MSDALISIENLTKSYGDKLLFDNITFGIGAGQKSALIARNGYGKSTLLNIITGHTLPDSGTVATRGDLRMAYLTQSPEVEPGQSVRSFVYNITRPDHEEPWDFEQRIEEILSRMKVDHMLDRPMSTLSGGEQKKVALCRILMDNCNLLILDEPTNHLDIEMIEWLEAFLSRQKLALLMVTHDRYFLDRVCQDIYELDNASLYHYRGGYDYYLEKRAQRLAAERAEAERARSLYRTELEWMRRMPQARGTKAQARIDRFYELEARAHVRTEQQRPVLSVRTERIGGKVVEINNLCYGNIVHDFSYSFRRGEKIGIVGANGAGKSTFLNLLTEQLHPDSGRVTVGQTVKFGYYTQNGMQAPADRRVIELVKDVSEQIDLADGRSLSAHQFLSYFGFDGTTQYNYFGNLSGGERRRLYLLMVLMTNPNFLILDEPTNDLDIYTLQILEQFLQEYRGCLVIVSHDRYFLDHTVDHLLVFESEGRIRDYHSTYTDYRRLQASTERQATLERREQKPRPTRSENRPRRASYKEQCEYRQLTTEIEALNAERAKLTDELSSGIDDHQRLLEASRRIGEIGTLLDEKELRWLELDELIS